MVAACDAEVLGKKLKFNGLEIEINENFYFEKFCSEDELKKLLKEAKIANLFGEKIRKVVVGLGLAKEKDFKNVEGVPHLQVYRI